MAAGAVHFHGRQARSGLEDGGRRIGGAVSTSCCARQARTRAARRAPWASASGAEVAANYAASERTCKSAGTALQINCATGVRLRPAGCCAHRFICMCRRDALAARASMRTRIQLALGTHVRPSTTRPRDGQRKRFGGDHIWGPVVGAYIKCGLVAQTAEALATRRAGCLPSWLRARCWQRA